MPRVEATAPEHLPSSSGVADTAELRAVALVYAGYFAALGVQGPFLALYLGARGIGPSDVAYLLALFPVVRVLTTPAWTLLADRIRSASVVLRLVSIGAFVAFALLGLGLSNALLACALVAFTAFRAPATSLADTLALDAVARTGSEFGRVRVWGTAAYMASTLGAGILIRRMGAVAIVPTTTALLAFTVLATFALPAGIAPTRVPLLPAVASLLRRPRFLALLGTAALHQVGLAAYDSLFPAYLTRVANASYAGSAVALGALAEVIFMARARGVIRALGLPGTLVLAYGGSAVRWALLALAPNAFVLVAAQLLHALTFGAFYLAAVALVDHESPPEVRASGQGLFATCTWGVASACSLVLAGRVQARAGMPGVFAVAAVASTLATLGALALRRRSE